MLGGFSMLNCCAVVIWYTKDENECNSAMRAVLSYASFFKTVYIIDNSASDNVSYANQIKNTVYVPNKANLGIATALNQGCELAKNSGFEWCMTMDQDSIFESEQLAKYLELVENNLADTSIKSFSIRQNDFGDEVISVSKWIRCNILSPVKRKFIKVVPYKAQDIEFVNHTITSANIINLSAWEEVGKFDDKLFIDEVDVDFCIRLRIRNYNILHFNICYVNHKLGEKRFSIFSKIQYESDFRLFYIFRNLMIENKRYGKLPFVKNYKKELFYYFRDYCILDFHVIKHNFIFFKAYFAYKKFMKEELSKH